MTWDFLSIIGYTAFVLGLVAHSQFPPLVALAFLFMFVLFKALGRALGGVRDVLYYSFMGFSYLAILLFLVQVHGWREIMGANLVPVLVSIMGGGFSQILGYIVKMIAEGSLPTGLMVFFLGALLLFRYWGARSGSILVFYRVFRFAPLFVLALFFATFPGDVRRVLFTAGSVIALLCGSYVLIYGFTSSLKGAPKRG